jgi:hypothetical protein
MAEGEERVGMRVLVGNHIDVSLRRRKDMRSWTQRIVWFARDGDLLVLPSRPDEEFVRYVTSLTGIDLSTLTIHIPPPGTFGDHLMDSPRLADEDFIGKVSADLHEVDEIFALWPSAQVSRFAAVLGLGDRYPGAAFFSQGGGELVNNKAYFRALAAACGVPIAHGRVCYSVDDAVEAMTRLLDESDAVFVKQAHNGAGSGNQAVIRGGRVETGRAGAKHVHHLTAGPQGIAAYWEERWTWASADGRFPVVVEEFKPGAATVYSEYHVADDGVRPTEAGSLTYTGGRISLQTVPLRGLPAEVHERLVAGGRLLAETYRAVGYRGLLSADAIVDPSGEVTFTEVNAQVSGSAHLYRAIAHKVVDVWREPMRSVAEYHWPAEWPRAGFAEFLAAADELGCAFDPSDRKGIIVSTPFDEVRGLVFCIVHETDEERDAVHQRLDRRLRTA